MSTTALSGLERRVDASYSGLTRRIIQPTTTPAEESQLRNAGGEEPSLTCDELVERAMAPNHPLQSQLLLAGTDGRSLSTCVFNGYTGVGKPVWVKGPDNIGMGLEAKLAGISAQVTKEAQARRERSIR
jgi:hypothetical protein